MGVIGTNLANYGVPPCGSPPCCARHSKSHLRGTSFFSGRICFGSAALLSDSGGVRVNDVEEGGHAIFPDFFQFLVQGNDAKWRS